MGNMFQDVVPDFKKSSMNGAPYVVANLSEGADYEQRIADVLSQANESEYRPIDFFTFPSQHDRDGSSGTEGGHGDPPTYLVGYTRIIFQH